MAKAKSAFKYTFRCERGYLYVGVFEIEFLDGMYQTNDDAEAEYLRCVCDVIEVGE